ncbi:histidine kinase [Pseudothermotoga hypogea DSM 11164 = NBRC 106472]|uniref:histidine kinase n=1 Tax=Pseudothermotoga hypogea DSM 11164 = NBRC 106472 TaxID=1123384 RepID=A0A0X1KQM9_9THEM|nr:MULTISPECIES: sensor histidine kinase [Pseudothermotoga]AJC73615.1 histidine kinase [Pseudothermotoga hypogea DSM 11164 = NBRC 106472]MDI6862191.1 ATP-binding protein [Pseudothermotoga sp.]
MRFFDLIMEFLESGYQSHAMDKLAHLLCEEVQAEACDVFLFEDYKSQFRLVGSTHGQERVGQEKFGRDELEKLESCFLLEHDANVIGAVVLKKVKKTEALQELLKELSKTLWVAEKIVSMRETMEKYELLSELTDVFHSCGDPDSLLKGTLSVMKKALNAEAVLYLVKDKEGYIFKDAEGVDKNQLIYERLPANHSFVTKVEKSERGIVLTKTQLDFLGIKVKSAIACAARLGDTILGIIIAVNKIAPTGYRSRYSFDELDLATLNDMVKRYSLAHTRVEYQQSLKEQIERLTLSTKEYERLIQQQQEYLKKMDLVHSLSNAMRASYDLVNVYKILLLGLTSGRGFAFNRALLLIRDRKTDTLVGKMWLGPEDGENIEEIWKEAEKRAMIYGDFSQYLREEAMILDAKGGLTARIDGRMFHYKDHPILERVVLRRRIIHVTPSLLESFEPSVRDLVNLLGVDEFLVLPLVGRWDTIGVVVLDNKFTKKPISEVDIEVLRIVVDSAGLAIENVMNYEELRKKTDSLEKQKNVIDYLHRFTENILQNLSTGIAVIDKNGRILQCNRMFSNIVGLPQERIAGEHYFELGAVFQDLLGVAMTVQERREAVELSEYRIEGPQGEIFLNVKYSPLWDPMNETITGVIVTLEDVTQKVRMEQEQKEREKLMLLGEVAARVAHELRNPITVIGGFINRARRNLSNTQTVEKYLDVISKEVENLERIVTEILEFSKPKSILEFTRFDMNELIEEVVYIMQEKAKKANVIIETKLSSAAEVVADRAKLKRVLINLVQNAIEASPPNGKIVVRSFQEADRVVVSVFNMGEPLSDKELRKIFTPFYTTKTQGTGLGLPICKKIVEDEHGGRIWAEPKNNGMEFFFEIPVKGGKENVQG